jgi:hypothetical protein
VTAKPEDELRASGSSEEMGVFTPSAVAPRIHVGQRVVVEEHTATADVYLDAVAMEPAATGSIFHVRLKFGGKVALAVAAAQGEAELASAGETVR